MAQTNDRASPAKFADAEKSSVMAGGGVVPFRLPAGALNYLDRNQYISNMEVVAYFPGVNLNIFGDEHSCLWAKGKRRLIAFQGGWMDITEPTKATVIKESNNSTSTVNDVPGAFANAVAVNPVTNKIYTANYGSRDSSEIDGATNAVTSVPTGKHPWAIAVDSRANKTYVVNEDSGSVSILDGATGSTKSVSVGDVPFAVAVNSTANRAYVLTYSGSTMTVIDGATGTLTRTVPLALAMPDG